MKLRIKTTVAVLTAVVFAAGAAGCSSPKSGNAPNEGKLSIALQATDIPNLDTGMTFSQGAEGMAFVGMSLYDGLTKLDLSDPNKVPPTAPGLATEWSSNSDATRWTFKLRTGVQFTDGTPWNAKAAAFNINRYADKNSAQYYPELAATIATYVGNIAHASVLDDMTIEITTSAPAVTLPDNLAYVPMGSEAAITKLGNAGFAAAPVGTGPFIYESSSKAQLNLSRNDNYWGTKAKVKSLVLKPMADPTSRVAALRSGQVDWINAPLPDDTTSLKAAGYQIAQNAYDHIWNWQLNSAKSEPLSKLEVRQALNFAIDRKALADSVLQGIGKPAFQVSPEAAAVNSYRESNNIYSYDPGKAKQLLTKAGYPDGFTMTLAYPTGGSGNIVPKPMNETLQAQLAKVGVKVVLQPVEWASMLSSVRTGKIPGDADAMQASNSLSSNGYWTKLFGTNQGFNLSHFSDPSVDQQLATAAATKDAGARSEIYARIAETVTKNAPWLFVVSDLNPRAMTTKVHGFVAPQSWYVDLTTVSVD